MKKFYSILPAFIAWIFLSVSTLSLKAQLSGNYTIDPSQPTAGTNFRYFGDAFTALNTIGVNGPTEFNIASGTYDTLLLFTSAITGMGATAPITFQSATGNAADVVINGNSTANTVAITGAHHLVFRNLTINANLSTSQKGINISSTSHDILIENNFFVGYPNATTATGNPLIYSKTNSYYNNVIVRNNTFSEGSVAVYFDLYTVSVQYGNVVENNIMVDYNVYGIYANSQNGIIIEGNNISTTKVNTDGIYLYNTDYAKILENKIIQPNNIGLYLYNCDGSVANRGEISNNFISISGISTTMYGLYLNASHYYNVYNNSINCCCNGSINSSLRSVFCFSSDSINFRNNVFSAQKGGYAFYCSSNAIKTDYNNYFSGGAVFGNFNNTDVSTINDWQFLTGQDAHSISAEPCFLSSTDLHSVGLACNNVGIPISSITNDIDGEARNTLTPDIGADEYSPLEENAGVTEIASPTFMPFPEVGTSYDTKIRIKNFGSQNLISATINWTIDGIIQTPFAWHGNLSPDSVSSEITIGTTVFNIKGNHTLTAWTTFPNDSTDSYTQNDSASMSYYVCDRVLSGNYTIDPAQPASTTNFQYFSDVLITLNECGISDTTVFNIVPGTYDTLLTIPASIPFCGPSAQVVFQSSTGNPNDVTLTNSVSTSTNNYIVKVNGSRFITFRNLSFVAPGTTYGVCVKLTNGANNILLEGNNFSGQPGNSMLSTKSLVYNDENTIDTNIVIRNNTFVYGNFGVYSYCSGTVYENGNIIENNIFTDYYTDAIYATKQKNINILNNVFTTNSTSSSGTAIHLGTDYFSIISKNKISQRNRYGIFLDGCYGNISTYTEISNNFVTISGSTTAYGIYIYNTSYCKVLHNSVNCTSTNTSEGRAFGGFSGNNNLLQNNIFFNSGGGYAIHIVNTVFTSDYNNLFSSGAVLGSYNSTYLNSLSSWQSTTNKDLNSVSMDPSFYSAADLHTRLATMNNIGSPAGIFTDIDNETRSLTNPDLGADEFTPPTEDASLFAITGPDTLPSLITGTAYDLKVKIKNFGSHPLSKVEILWSVNGAVQSPYSWTGSIAPDSVSNEVIFATYIFPAQGNYDVKIWTNLPNDSIDLFPENDTASRNYMVCNVVFAGNYTINPALPTAGTNFRYFGEVLSNLAVCGISDTTVFEIASGIYDTLLTFNSVIPGHGVNTPITFQSATGNASDVTIQHAATSTTDNYIIDLNGASYMSFRNLSIKATGALYAKCIVVRNNSRNILIEGNAITGAVATSETDNQVIIFSDYSVDSNIVIRNNNLLNGSYSILMRGIDSNYEKNNVIEGNTIFNFYSIGIYSSYQRYCVIKGNTIESMNTSFSNARGIDSYKSDYSKTLKNKVFIPSGVGISFTYCYGSSVHISEVLNNVIAVGGSVSSNCMSLSNCSYSSICHNSLNCYSTYSSTSKTFGFYSSSNCIIKNNIFANTGGGYAFYTNSSNFVSDYNELYTSGINLGYANAANRTSLAAWITTTQKDSNSQSVAPHFISATDLRTYDVSINDAGTPVNVTEDIEGNPRSLTSPDIGAWEFDPLANNAGVLEISKPVSVPYPEINTSYPASVRVKNYGSSVLSKVTIEWSLNDITQTPVIWNGSIAPDSVSNEIPIGNITFLSAGNNVIKAWATLPNDSADLITSNDTVSKSYYACQEVLAGIYTIDTTIVTGGTNFKRFADVMSVLNECGVRDTTVFNIAPAVYENVMLTFSNTIPGIGPSAPITFQSSTGNNNDVLLRNNAANSPSNFIVKFAGVKNICFKDITFESLSPTYEICIMIMSNASSILLENNIIMGSPTTSTDKYNSLMYFNGSSKDSNVVVRNNYFQNGSYAIYIDGDAANIGYNNILSNNTLVNYYVSGIYAVYENGLQVSNNTISSNTTYASSSGVHLYYCDYSGVSGNKITHPLNIGLWISYSDCDAANMGEISNNFVSVGGNSLCIGISMERATYFNLFHNSVNCTATGTSSFRRAVYYYVSTGCNFKNNIFSSPEGGYAFYSTNTSFTSDYNDLYTSGAYLGYCNSTNIGTLSDWSLACQQDSNSISVDPDYISDSDLHTFSSHIDGQGTPTGVLTDIDGETRNILTPDIGADEFIPASIDAGVSTINLQFQTSFPVVDSLYPVAIRIKNFGISTLTKAEINWSVNGTLQTPIQWTGVLLPDSVSTDIPIGTAFFTAPGNNSISAWTTLPNDSIDHYNYNDTATVNYSACATIFSGLYNIDPAQPSTGYSYQYFSEVMDILAECGVSDTTVFNIASGVYDTLLSFNFPIPGIGSDAPVIFSSATGIPSDVIIKHKATSSSLNYVFEFYGARYISLKNLSIQAMDSTYAKCISITRNCSNLTIENNIISGPSSSSTNINTALIHDNTSFTDTNIVINNNVIMNGAYGIYLAGRSSGHQTGCAIKGNTISNFRVAGIYCQYADGTEISGNVIGTSFSGISLYGIQSKNNQEVCFSRNKVTMPSGYGVDISSCSGVSGHYSEISNNFISVYGSSAALGINAASCSYINFLHNSINIESTDTTNGVVLLLNNCSNSNIANNILENSGGGFTLCASTSSFTSDYNNINTSGSRLSTIDGTIYPNLQAFVSSTSNDTHSTDLTPRFTSSSDLHIPGDTALNSTGTFIGVLYDIDGELRSTTTPDIGADEFNPLLKDVGVIAIIEPTFLHDEYSQQPVVAVIKNFGSDTLHSIPMNYTINQGAPSSYTWTGTLAYDEQDTVVLPNVVVPPHLNIVSVYTTLPGDGFYANDTLSSRVFGLPEHIYFADDMEFWTSFQPESSLWEHGQPIASTINIAHSPYMVWATNLDGNYPDNALAYLNSPVFNFSGVSEAYLSFYYWLDVQENTDGLFLQYSTDNGQSWDNLGTINDTEGYNWFNSQFSNQEGWSKNSGGWQQAFYPLSDLTGYSQTKLRFGFSSDASSNFNGVAIDDFEIRVPAIQYDAGIRRILNPSDSINEDSLNLVKVVIQNFGIQTITSLSVGYMIPATGIQYSETWTGQLLSGDTVVFAFSDQFSLPDGNYSVCAFTTTSGDVYTYNDSMCKQLYSIPSVSISEHPSESLNIFPNPASDMTEICFTLHSNCVCNISIQNSLGKTIQSYIIDGTTGQNKIPIDFSTVEPGLYICRVQCGNHEMVKKINVVR